MTEPSEAATPAGFAALGLDPRLTKALGYDDPSPIQREAIPVLITGADIVGLAGTGTGKTAAFALPIIHRLANLPRKERKAGVATLILTPTRELAIQVAKAVKTYGKPVGIEVTAIYGGTGYAEQIRAIRSGVDFVIATPGRALDLIQQGKFPLDAISAVVLDEADEMLDMGFAEDIESILSKTPAERQTMLFSATMPPRIEDIARKYLRTPKRIQVARAKPVEGEEAKVRQLVYYVRREHKLAALGRILDVERPQSSIIFCRTRNEADDLTEMLSRRGFLPLALHGGLSQEQRDRVMQKFRTGHADLLVATDIAARGLDISHLSHVVDFDVPPQAETYVHRIGRVGRAGRTGVAITLAAPGERWAVGQIERETKWRLEIASIPSPADLRQRRLERTRDKITEEIPKGQPSEPIQKILDALKETHGESAVMQAMFRMMSQSGRPEDEQEIPNGDVRPQPTGKDKGKRREPFGNDRAAPAQPSRYGVRGGKKDNANEDRKRAGRRPTAQGMTKVFFGIGYDAGVSPRDIVGAIANEAGVPGGDIGAIDMTDRFTLVELPQDIAGYVIDTMQGTRIRGRKVHVRPDRPPKS